MPTEATTPATNAADERLFDLKLRSWNAHQSSLQAQILEAEELARRLPIEAERAAEELETAKKNFREAKEALAAAEGNFRLLGESVRAAKSAVSQLRAEFELCAGQMPRQ